MTEQAQPTHLTGSVTLRYAELCQFRRIACVGLDADEKTTILVGANSNRP